MKILGIVIILAIIGTTIFLATRNDASKNSLADLDVSATPIESSAGAIASETASITPSPSASLNSGSNVEKTVVFDGTKFTPLIVTIRVGDKVIFKNDSTTDMWPASGPHPQHDAYPEKGGCRGSAFDACQNIKPGSSWSFVFNIKGNWQFHDHLHPSANGLIVVQ